MVLVKPFSLEIGFGTAGTAAYDAPMTGSAHGATYEELRAAHRWDVPERYNIAADVCDKHPRDKPAMIWESFDGTTRELDWGELQDLANQAAHMLARARRRPRRPRRRRAAADAGDRGDLLRRLEARRDPALDVGALRRRRDRAPAGATPSAKLLVTDAANAPRFERPRAPTCSCSTSDTLAGASTDFICADTAADDPAQLYYTSGTTGLAKGIVHAHRYLLGARGVHVLPRGRRTASASTAWASGRGRRGSRRCSGRGGSARCSASTSARAASIRTSSSTFLSRHEVTNVFTTPTAMRSMMAIDDAGTRYPQQFRRVCSAGEPLNPEAIRWFREQYGVTVLDYYGLTESYPLVANYPFMEVREGSMGRPMPGWDVQILDEDERPVGVRASAARSACARARTRTIRSGYWRNDEASERDVRRRVVPHEGRRRAGRGRLLSGTRAAPTT